MLPMDFSCLTVLANISSTLLNDRGLQAILSFLL